MTVGFTFLNHYAHHRYPHDPTRWLPSFLIGIGFGVVVVVAAEVRIRQAR